MVNTSFFSRGSTSYPEKNRYLEWGVVKQAAMLGTLHGCVCCLLCGPTPERVGLKIKELGQTAGVGLWFYFYRGVSFFEPQPSAQFTLQP